jgi:type VI secretion system secreted protein Hcp
MLRRTQNSAGVLLGMAIVTIAWLLTGNAEAAQTVHLTLVIDGNQVQGESRVVSLEREGTIECSSFTWGVAIPTDETGFAIGARHYQPVTFTKRIDKSSPLLAKALAMNQPVSRAEFRFYRPSPGGSGVEENFYTIVLEDGYIRSISAVSEDAMLGGQTAPPMMETVSVVFGEITWTYEVGGVECRDDMILD